MLVKLVRAIVSGKGDFYLLDDNIGISVFLNQVTHTHAHLGIEFLAFFFGRNVNLQTQTNLTGVFLDGPTRSEERRRLFP